MESRSSLRGLSPAILPFSLVAVALLAASVLAPARAENFPTRTVRIVVAFPAGGPTDFVARLLADRLKTSLGQSVVVENKPGANGTIGAEYVARGEGGTKKKAEQLAAKQALEHLRRQTQGA